MIDNQGWKLAATALSAAAASGAIVAGLLLSKSGKCGKGPEVPEKWVRVGEVSQLTIFPIKSCQGVNINEAIANILGLKVSSTLRDRVFVVVTAEGIFRTQRQLPRMSLIGVAVNENEITLTAPDKSPVTFTTPEYQKELVRSCKIFDDVVKTSLDCGDEVGHWLSEFLQVEGLRLYHHYGEQTQREMVPLQKKFPHFVPTDKGAFQDQTSFMLAAEESLTELNQHLETPVKMVNFRPTILIKGIPEPFAEDMWAFIRIGNSDGPVFKTAKPCTRCKLTTVIPEKGDFDEAGEPLKTLYTLKRSYGHEKVDQLCKSFAVLGNQLGLLAEGRPIRVGDPVYAAVV